MSLPPPALSSCALITGSSSGLGVELARALARRGHNVVLVARRTDMLESVAAEIERTHGVRADVVTCDLGDADAREKMLADLDSDVEILVNNAGVATSGSFQDTDAAKVEAIARVNVEAVVSLTARLLPGMLKRGRGGILNVSSTTAFQPMTGHATYAASKAFVLSFTEGLHHDLAGTGVTATVLCPGPVKTELWEAAGADGIADRTPGFLWTSGQMVAEDGIKGLDAGKRVVVPGVFNRVSALSGQHAPRSVVLRLSGLLR